MTSYVIFGFEWSTKQRGAAPEVSEYKVLKVLSNDSADNIKFPINSVFLQWREQAQNKVWRQIADSFDFSESFSASREFIKTFFKNSDACWYFLSEDEYKEWLIWKEEGGAVEEGTLDLTSYQ